MRARSWMLCGDWVLRGETRQESIHTGDIVCFSVCSRLKPKWKLHWIAIELNCDCDCVYGIQKQTNNTTIILNAQHKHMQIVCTVSSFILSLTLSLSRCECVYTNVKFEIHWKVLTLSQGLKNVYFVRILILVISKPCTYSKYIFYF